MNIMKYDYLHAGDHEKVPDAAALQAKTGYIYEGVGFSPTKK